VRFIAATKSDFHAQFAKEIIDLIRDLLCRSPVAVQTGLIIITNALADALDLSNQPELFELTWQAVLNVITRDPSRISKLSSSLTSLFVSGPLSGRDSVAVTRCLASIDSDLQSAKPLVKLIPYLSLGILTNLFEKLRILAETQGLLLEVGQFIYEESSLSDIPEETFRALAELYKDHLDTDSYLAIYAPIAAVNSEEDFLAELIEAESPIRIRVLLQALKYMSNDNVDLDFSPPEEVMTKVVEFLIDPRAEIRTLAFDCLQGIIENDVFIEPEDAEKVLAVFPQVDAADVDRFYQLLYAWLNVEGIDDQLVEKVFDFAYLMVRLENKYLRQNLKVFTNIPKMEEDMTKSVIDDLLPIALQLLNSGDTADIVAGASAMIDFLRLDGDCLTETVKFDTLRAIVTAQSDEKVKGKIAILMAALAAAANSEEQCVIVEQTVSEFAKSQHPALLKSAAKMGKYHLKRTAIYDALIQPAFSLRDPPVLNQLLFTLRKIVKLQIPKCDGKDLAKTFVSGSHPVFNRRPVAAFGDTESQIFRFVAVAHLPESESSLLKWFNDAPFPMISRYLEAISNLKFASKHHREWVSVFSRRISNATAHQKEIMLGFILRIVRVDHTICDIDFLVSQLLYLLEEAEDSEHGWTTAISSAILELSALGAEMDEDVVKDILADYPFDPQFGHCGEASRAIVTMIDSGNWIDLAPAAALCFSEVLCYSVQKLKEYGLTSELRDDMRRVAGQIFESNPELKKLTLQSLGDKSIVLKRFHAVFD
jgi:hypothetical protein